MIAATLKTLIALGCTGFGQLDNPRTDYPTIAIGDLTISMSYQKCYEPLTASGDGTYSWKESPEQLRSRAECLLKRATQEEKDAAERLAKEEKCDKAVKALRAELWGTK